MHEFPVRNLLGSHQAPSPGTFALDSRRFPGHEARLSAHVRRVWSHVCQAGDGQRCRDCLYGGRR
jgi:hypothetical protein